MIEKITKTLNLTGICCPLPLIQLSQSIEEIDSGQLVQITGNDPIFESTIRDYCTERGHDILDVIKESNRVVTMILRKR